MTEKLCHGCAGTGIGAHVSPREAQLLAQTIYLVMPAPDEVKPPEGFGVLDAKSMPRLARRHVRVDAWSGLSAKPYMRGRMAFSGPLLYVIAEIERWLRDGWQLERGHALPPKSALCEWCGGGGREGAVLTAHTMQQALENGD